MASETYTVKDFIDASEKLWPDKKTRPSRYLINAAFRMKGIDSATKDEGVKLVNDFAREKVD